MKTRSISTSSEFLAAAGESLLKDEIRHSLTFGIAERVSQHTHVFGPDDPWFLLLEDRQQICATAIRTPPHRPILSHLSGELKIMSSELVRAIHEVDSVIPGVVGDKKIAEPFTQQWCESYRVKVVKAMAQRIYKLTEVIAPNFAEGRLRQANADDEEIVLSWAAAFYEEAMRELPSGSHHERHHEAMRNGDVYLWDNAGPRSMAMRARPTRHGISIVGVYTPPENRNYGYASSCVAALCGLLLSKYDFCVLYTDLANPVSNSIYQKIGFSEYCDSLLYTYSEQA